MWYLLRKENSTISNFNDSLPLKENTEKTGIFIHSQ